MDAIFNTDLDPLFHAFPFSEAFHFWDETISIEMNQLANKCFNNAAAIKQLTISKAPSETTTDGTSDGFWDFSLTR